MVQPALQFIFSAREYELLQKHLFPRSTEKSSASKEDSLFKPPSRHHDHNASAFRSAFRIYLLITTGTKSWDLLSARLLTRKPSKTQRPNRPLVASPRRLAVSLATIVFLHRLMFRFFSRLRLRLLHEKAKRIEKRYPKLYAALTSRVAPVVGSCLAGFALSICPADQLRVTIAIFAASRSLEFLYNALDGAGYFQNKPWWVGSWLLFPIAQGQLLHAFVFDRDCFPKDYGDFILQYTPDYIQRRPENLSKLVAWPNSNQIVDSIASMAKLNWPAFTSPILHPQNKSPLPSLIDPIISPITSRANPGIQHLSCALIHPSEPSCFAAYLQHNLKAFPMMARFFALYYGAFSLLRIKQLFKSPALFLNNLAKQVLKTTAALSGAIGVSWGSICLFAAIFPRTFLPKFRFFLGGLLGGCFQFLDRGSAGHVNSMYAMRTSVDSLWKVGVKHGWWRGIQGGDVLLFVAAAVVMNVVCEYGGGDVIDRERGKWILKLMRGEAELGLMNERGRTERKEEIEEEMES